MIQLQVLLFHLLRIKRLTPLASRRTSTTAARVSLFQCHATAALIRAPRLLRAAARFAANPCFLVLLEPTYQRGYDVR